MNKHSWNLFLSIVVDPNLFNGQLDNQTLSSAESEWAVTNKSPPSNLSSPTSSPLAHPDVIQTPAPCNTELKVRKNEFCFDLWKSKKSRFMFYVNRFEYRIVINSCFLSINKKSILFLDTKHDSTNPIQC